MIHSTYITAILIASIFSWASFLVVIYKLAPFSNQVFSLSAFYASLFVALSATFTLIFYFLRVWTSKTELYNTQLNASLRQGLLVACMLVIGLGFQRLRVLTWWDALLLLGIVLLIELYMMKRD